MKRSYWVLTLSILVLGLSACQSMGTSPAASAMSDKNALRVVIMDYQDAVNNSNLDQLMGLYTEQAIQVAPNEMPINGLLNIRSRASANHAEITYALSSKIDDIRVSGDLATVTTSFTEIMASRSDASDSVTTSGIWILLLERQGSNSWKIFTEIWNYEAPVNWGS